MGDTPFAPCVRALRNSASGVRSSTVICIGYEARCFEKRVPDVFSNPNTQESVNQQTVDRLIWAKLTELRAWALFASMNRVGAWTIIRIVEDLLRALKYEIGHLWDLGVHVFRNDLGVLWQVSEDSRKLCSSNVLNVR